jgi:predicted NAD-dependent protein-ADP-ribosyltransferase YbiA (DUF1768 family)
MNKDDYINDINLFYKLKNKYDKRREDLKNKLLKKYNLIEAKKKFKNVALKCVNCGNIGGTKFIINNNFLIAKCNSRTKCNLSIKIKKGKYIEHGAFQMDIKNHLESLKKKIIENKLKLLFNLEEEEIIITEFDSLKAEYHEFTEKDKLLNIFMNNLNKTKWENYMEFYKTDMKEAGEEATKETTTKSMSPNSKNTKKSEFKSEMKKRDEHIKKDDLIKIINAEIYNNVSELKLLLNEYHTNENKDKLRMAVKIYIDKILPNNKKLRNLKYSEFYIQEIQIGGGSFGQAAIFDYKTVNKRHSYDDMEVIIEEYKTIEKILDRNKVGKMLTKQTKQQLKSLKPVNLGATLTFKGTSKGFTIQELENMKNKIKDIFADANVDIFDLREVLPEAQPGEAQPGEAQPGEAHPASILIFKNGVNLILNAFGKNYIDLFNEHNVLKKDKKSKKKRDLNAKLCFADIGQTLEQGGGCTTVPFSSLPLTSHIRELLPKIIGEKATTAEGNYYDINQVGRGFQGENDAIGMRFGDDDSGFPLYFQWFLKNEPVGDKYKFDLKNGDLYIMSEKSMGNDWKNKNVLTLRRAMGADKYLKTNNQVDPETIKLMGETLIYDEQEGDLFEDMTDNVKKGMNQMERPDLYDDSSIFVFYSKSSDVMPGKGGNKHKDIEKKWSEKVSDPTKFDALSKIKDWRKVLSNMWVGPNKPLFNLDGYGWASVEHWFHANKFKWRIEESEEYKDFYEKFTFESDSEISKNPKLALTAGGRSGKVGGKKYRPTTVVLDPNWEEKKERIMLNGQKAKYEQDKLSKDVLLATKDAKLVHLMVRRGKGSLLVNFNDTMEIRQSLGFRKLDYTFDKSITKRGTFDKSITKRGTFDKSITKRVTDQPVNVFDDIFDDTTYNQMDVDIENYKLDESKDDTKMTLTK